MTLPGVIRWAGVSNTTYTVQTTTNLLSTNWLSLGTATSVSTDFAFTNSGVADSQRFFRVAHP
jgi:hypothetical protein